MAQKTNILERTFDILSSFPYLDIRKVMKRMWIAISLLTGFTYLIEGIAIFNETVEFRSNWGISLVSWIGGSLFFGIYLHLWRKHNDKKLQTRKNKRL